MFPADKAISVAHHNTKSRKLEPIATTIARTQNSSLMSYGNTTEYQKKDMTDGRCLWWRQTYPATTLAILHPAWGLPGSGSTELRPCSSLISAEWTLSDSAKPASDCCRYTAPSSVVQYSQILDPILSHHFSFPFTPSMLYLLHKKKSLLSAPLKGTFFFLNLDDVS